MSAQNSSEQKSTKGAILALIITNCIIYGPILIPLSLCSYYLAFAVYSVAIILAYNIIEASCFFGCDAYNWPCTLTFRIIWILHDFAYFITFAVYASYTDGGQRFPFLVSCCIFFFVTFGINIATLVLFSKLPRSLCCGQLQVQPIIINLNGQNYDMQNVQNQGPATVQTGVPRTTVHAPAYGPVPYNHK